ncbi:MAG: cation:proton antiporter [Moraxella sp.]|nr:cation:proton antiporter [Moraxella sp.]
MTDLLLYTFVYLSFAVIAVMISQRAGFGSVLGYLLAGIAIGPVLGFVGKETQSIQHVAEFGVVMMLFVVGLELAPKMLWQMRHKLIGLGGLQVGLSLFAILMIALWLGFSWQIGVALGCILSLSSTAIVLQTLAEKKQLNTQGGRAGFAVLLFQDVSAIPMLTLLPLLGVASVQSEQTTLLSGMDGWVIALVGVGAIALIVMLMRYAVPFSLRTISRYRIHEMFLVFTLTVVVGIATLMSLVGLSPALGAFIAGVALANSPYRHEMESQLNPFKSLFLGLFFITVGASMNFALLKSDFSTIIVITLALMTLKGAILFGLGKLFRLSPLANKLFALSLAGAGEFGFVLISVANHSRVLPKELSDKMLLVVALSMILTPLCFVAYEKIFAKKALKDEQPVRTNDDIAHTGQVVILGHGRFGQQVNSLLMACGFSTTVIDNHVEMIEGLAKFGIQTYYGDATRPEMLNSIGLKHAKMLIICLASKQASTDIIGFVRRHYPHLTILARAYDGLHAFDLHHAGANYIIRETADSAIRSGRIALEQLGLSKEKARQLSKFYEARERHHLGCASFLHDPNILVYDNKAMTDLIKQLRDETHEMMGAILRDERVDWQEDPECWTRTKKGIS